MESMIGISILLVVLFFIYKFARMAGSSIPTTDQSVVDYFKSRTRDDYYYHYYLDGTGYALSVERVKICLVNGNLHNESNYKIYDRSQIRNISWTIEGYEYMHEHSIHPTAMMNNSIRKRDAKFDAYKDSGIFIKVADIDHPTWQIRFSDKRELEKNFEILQQFMEGVLPIPANAKAAKS